MKKEDLLKLNSADLFFYLTHVSEDKEHAELIGLLRYAETDDNKRYKLMKDIVMERIKLFAVYPMLDEEKPSSDMILIGSIPDGALYYMKL